ncbi:nucleotidyltransferase domain-containing protein [Pseudomonas sp. COR18]|uniref:nucleotidyltransferase domain-containing protein n=1 Tax=Pseudomonas sp. COR18 TaxID=3399680 RepID=UPI003B0005BA
MDYQAIFHHLAREALPNIQAALLVGSFSEGLQTKTSDYDFFLVVDRESKERVSKQLIRRYEGRLVEYTLLTAEDIGAEKNRLLAENFSFSNLRDAEVLYKLLFGKPVHGSRFYESLIQDVDVQAFKSKLIAYHLFYCQNRYEDLIGSVGEDDLLSAVYFAQVLVDCAVDAWLVQSGDAYPKVKWRLKRARRKMGESSDLFCSYRRLFYPVAGEATESYKELLVKALSLYRRLLATVFFGSVESASEGNDSVRYRASTLSFVHYGESGFIASNGDKYYALDITSTACVLLLNEEMAIEQLAESLTARSIAVEGVDSLQKRVSYLCGLGLLGLA